MRLVSAFGALALLVAADALAPAQYPPYPGGYPPGGYPPGACPPGYPCGGAGGGIPFPGRNKKKKKDDQEPLQSLSGMLRQLNDKRIILEADDTRLLDFKRQDSTKFLKDGDPLKPDVLKPGDHLMIEYRQDDEGYMTAVNVTLEKEGTAAEREHASEPVEIIEPVAQGKSDDDRPKLHRADSKKADSSDTDTQPPAQQAGPAQTPAAPTPAQAPPTQTPAAPTSPPPAEAAKAPAAAAPASAPAELPPIVPPDAGIDLDHIPTSTSSHTAMDASDTGPPKVARGKPKPKKTTDADKADDTDQVALNTQPPAPRAQPAPSASAPVAAPAGERPALMTAQATEPAPGRPALLETGPPVDARVEKAREAVGAFSETLPDYLCQEQMARFQSDSPKVSWAPLDIVSMELVYEKGKERYRNLQINGKPAKAQRIEDLAGSWSTGEFASVLLDLFSPATATDFRYRHTSRSGGREAYLYDFAVDHEHSHWQIHVASQSILPAYKGSVWIDKETARILRIEMQAVHLPGEFPLDQIEMATDYEFIRIADREFLLPVHSENLLCQRGSSMCSHNVIDFRNYHKYTGEATIEFAK